MNAFFNDISINPFLLTGLLAGILASVACGTIGPYVITRRIVFLSGAIAHMAIGGIGAAIFLAYTFPQTLDWLKPIHGAIAAALLAAVLIGVIHDRVTERLDTLIGAMWAIGMSIGILLIKYTPGYHTELMSYLFGNIVFVQWSHISMMLLLNIIIIIAVIAFYKRLLAICLDQQQAQLQGVNVMFTNIVLLSMVALTVICLIQVVGLILVLALLTLPAATASHHTTRMLPMMIGSITLCMLLTTIPRIAVYGSRISPESAIVLTAGFIYLASVIFTRLRRVAGAE